MRKLLTSLFVSLLFSSLAFGAADKYLITTCATNGDGSLNSCTAGGAGSAGAWNTAANAESGLQTLCTNNLTTCGLGIVTIHASGATADAGFTAAGVTYDSTHYVILQGDWTSGVWDATKFHFTSATAGVVKLQDQFWHFDHIQGHSTGGGGGTFSLINDTDTDGINFSITNSLIWFDHCVGGGSCYGVYQALAGTANDTTTFVNNIVYADQQTNTSEAVRLENPGTSRKIIFYGNTIRTATNGLVMYDGGATDSLYMKNNVFSNCVTDIAFFVSGNWSTISTATNITDDATSPNTSGCHGATCRSISCSYVTTTAGSENLHLATGDTVCKDTATDLSADAQYAYSTDIDGATRTGTWDIGADELSAANGTKEATLRNIGYH